MRKRLLRSLALFFLPPVGALFIRLFYYSSKRYFHLPQEVPQEPIIVACWHGDLFYLPYLYLKLRHKPNANVVISEHFDGQIIAKITRYFRIGTIHGSTTRGGGTYFFTTMTFSFFCWILALNSGKLMTITITPPCPLPRRSLAIQVCTRA